MANRVDATTPTRYYLNGFAQVLERIGLAILRTAWFNLDLLWAAALIGAGILTLIL